MTGIKFLRWADNWNNIAVLLSVSETELLFEKLTHTRMWETQIKAGLRISLVWSYLLVCYTIQRFYRMCRLQKAASHTISLRIYAIRTGFLPKDLLNITKTRLYNVDPLKPHFYVVKLAFTGVYIIFLISAQKHRLWVHVRTASSRRF